MRERLSSREDMFTWFGPEGERERKAGIQLVKMTGAEAELEVPADKAIVSLHKSEALVRLLWRRRPATLLLLKKTRTPHATAALCRLAIHSATSPPPPARRRTSRRTARTTSCG